VHRKSCAAARPGTTLRLDTRSAMLWVQARSRIAHGGSCELPRILQRRFTLVRDDSVLLQAAIRTSPTNDNDTLRAGLREGLAPVGDVPNLRISITALWLSQAIHCCRRNTTETRPVASNRSNSSSAIS
jgi:hypothetical protein